MAAAREVHRHAGDQTANRNRVLARLGALRATPGQRYDLAFLELEIGKDLFDDLAAGDNALADGGVEVVHRLELERLEQALQCTLGKFVADHAKTFLHDGAAEVDVLRPLLQTDEAPYAAARLAGDDEALPGGRRRLRLGADDLDLVAVVQKRSQRLHPPVDLGPDTGVADLRMNRVGEVHRGRPPRQGDQVALGREAEHLVLVHFELGMLEELLGVRGMLEDFEQFANPAILPPLRARQRAAQLLEVPVGGNAVLGEFVHFPGADLNLDPLALGPDHRGMNRLIAVRLGRRDEILEAARHHAVRAVNDAERLVAFGHRFDDHAEGDDVGELFERNVLALHLAPDRIGLLFAPGNRRHDIGLRQRALELGGDARHLVSALVAQELEPGDDRIARVRVDLGEGEALELVLHPLHADALGERREDFHGLARDALAFLGVVDELQRAHVVQAIGELDEEHANVLGHRQQQLAEVLGLLGPVRLELEAGQFGDAVDELRDLAPEQIADLIERDAGVLDRVVQQRGDDRRAVEADAGEYARDLDGM